MLFINLRPVLAARNIDNQRAFLVKSGISPRCAHALLAGKTRSLRLDHIELLCRVLVCEPADLLSFESDLHRPLPPNHPLHKLAEQPPDNFLSEAITNLPFKELKALGRQLREQQKGEM